MRNLLSALGEAELSVAARIAWTEAWEMHSLFHTAEPPFSYWLPETMAALRWLEPWVAGPGAPIVTLDAGDCAYFDASLDHRLRSTGPVDAEVLVVACNDNH